MFISQGLIVVLLSAFGACSPVIEERATLPPKFSIKILGNTTGLYPNTNRDGGGGGTISGFHYINFADTYVSSNGPPREDGSNFRAIVSNTIVLSNAGGGGPQSCADYGSNGIPKEQVPLFPYEGNVGIWPNANIATLCDGKCGVSFYPVVNRTTLQYLYTTGVNITSGGFGIPAVSRPVRTLWLPSEVSYGIFSSVPGVDGYLYVFGAIDKTLHSNGLKMARVPFGYVFDRTAYQFWNGAAWSRTMPKYDDGGVANIWNQSTPLLADGYYHGPASGDVFYNGFYGVWMVIYQAVGIDNNVYMVWSSDLTHGWSKPVVLFESPHISNYNYAVHAYPNYDLSGRVIPISFIQQAHYSNPASDALFIGWANVTFS